MSSTTSSDRNHKLQSKLDFCMEKEQEGKKELLVSFILLRRSNEVAFANDLQSCTCDTFICILNTIKLIYNLIT